MDETKAGTSMYKNLVNDCNVWLHNCKKYDQWVEMSGCHYHLWYKCYWTINMENTLMSTDPPQLMSYATGNGWTNAERFVFWMKHFTNTKKLSMDCE